MEKVRIASAKVQDFETDHISTVRELASECVVLLKNDKNTLPLEETGKIALYGNGARNTIKGGNGSGDVNVRHFVNIEEGLEKAGFEITTKDWLDSYDNLLAQAKASFFADLRRQADALQVNPLIFAMGKYAPEPEYVLPLDGEGDSAVYVLSRISGEGADRLTTAGDIQLTQTEVRDILDLNKKYNRFVLVLNVGGMVDLTPVQEVSAILLLGQLGTPAGDVLAEILTGKAYPSGKLTATWAPIEEYPSTEGFGDPNDTDYHEGIYVGYRYFDTAGKPVLYPFGYGLSYTDFSIFGTQAEISGSRVTVSADVKNTGSKAGKEVVQVYASSPKGTLDQPYQALAGFAKTSELAPGEQEHVEISFDMADLASYNEAEQAWVLEKGTYYLRAGNSSRNTHVAGAVLVEETVYVRKVRDSIADCGFEDIRLQASPVSYEGEESEKADARVMILKTDQITCRTIEYDPVNEELLKSEVVSFDKVLSGERTLEQFTGSLNEEQLATLCIGNIKETDNLLEIIGNASNTVAGAAGETTSRLKALDVPKLIMSDGPAGLRLSQEYEITPDGVKGSVAAGGDMLLVMKPEELAALAAPETGDDTKVKYYQYCVSIPIATDIAQSWNPEVAEKCGDLVGSEMERFGIHFWLAPAMNIQRSPLCGRNFEYYSEDPLISGLMAAAVTKGVQKHKGCAVTIKHYAANNQETNRFFSNSNVSSRALREIYLKGFEICIRDGAPHGMMTSYNLLNGEHTCNSHALVTDILRNEFGFEGVVMTDWLVTGGMGPRGEKWPCASAAGNVKAGNDLTMPGLPSDLADILDALHRADHPYALEKKDLQQCALRVLRQIIMLHGQN